MTKPKPPIPDRPGYWRHTGPGQKWTTLGEPPELVPFTDLNAVIKQVEKILRAHEDAREKPPTVPKIIAGMVERI